MLKAPLFVVVVVCLFKQYRHRSRRQKYIEMNLFPIIPLAYWYVLLGAFFILLGLQRESLNFLYYLVPLYIVYPLVWSGIAYLLDKNSILLIYKVLLISTSVVAAYTILFYLASVGYLPFSMASLIYSVELARNATVVNGVAAVNLVSISTLIFSVPFLLALSILPKPPSLIGQNRKLAIATILIALLAIIISGRRAALITVLLSFPISLWISSFLPKHERPNVRVLVWGCLLIIAIVPLAVFSLSFMSVEIGSYMRYILRSVTSIESVRSSQIEALLAGWSNSPLWGAGHGVSVDIIRHSSKPWRYEMSYVSLLFHTGILGLLGYSVGPVILYIKGYKIIQNGGDDGKLMVAQLVGVASMLLAYSTNPYLDALDILWVVFLPVAYANTTYIKARQKEKYSHTLLMRNFDSYNLNSHSKP